MGKKRIISGILISLALLIVIIHTLIHFIVYELGIFGLSETSISGFSIGKLAVGNAIKEGYPINAPLSRTIIIGEWVLIILPIIFAYARYKLTSKKELSNLKSKKYFKKSKTETDLDRLYDLLKEKKRLRFKVISQTFNVNKEVVEDWGKTLEAGNLATIEYPRIGDPEIVFKEKKAKVVSNEKEK